MSLPTLAATEVIEPKFPEIVVGLVAPYGTPLTYFVTTLQGLLKSKCDYTSEILRLSRLWEAAEKAAANRRRLIVPEISIEARGNQTPDTEPANASQAEDAEEET